MEIAHQLIVIFCEIDDFCKEFESYMQHRLLPGPIARGRGPSCSLALSDLATV